MRRARKRRRSRRRCELSFQQYAFRMSGPGSRVQAEHRVELIKQVLAKRYKLFVIRKRHGPIVPKPHSPGNCIIYA
jgi:hypothetical protein